MNAKKWTVLASVVVVALVATAVLGPLALAQGPNTDQASGIGFGANGEFVSLATGNFFGRAGRMGRMRLNNQTAGPMMGRGQGNGRCDNFVDEDGDGVCDLRGTGRGQGNGPGFVDEDGDGQCDNFVDEDGDGVCDLRRTGWGRGNGPGYEDADGDGLCDHAGSGGRQGMGPRRGGQGRWGGQLQGISGWGQQQFN